VLCHLDNSIDGILALKIAKVAFSVFQFWSRSGARHRPTQQQLPELRSMQHQDNSLQGSDSEKGTRHMR